MFRTFMAFLLISTFAAAFAPAQAQLARGDRWVRIAVQDVDLSSGVGTIDLSKTSGSFKGFRLRVMRNRIDFNQVQFVYTDGTVHQVDKTFRLSRREKTKPLDYRAERRFIEEVNIGINSSGSGKGTARLEVWGIQDRKGRVAKRPEAIQPVGTAGADKQGDGLPPLPTRLGGGTRAGEGDVLFGAQYLEFESGRDVIRVGRHIGKFEKIRLRVRDNDIYINDVKVIYSEGDPDTLLVNSEVIADAQTDWLELTGDRFVDAIHVNYKPRPEFEGQARIELFGLHTKDWLGSGGEGRKFNDGWVLLGAQPAGFIGFDRDVIPVGKNSGGFKKLRVSVRDRAITLNQLKVIYDNGQEDIIPVRARVNAGSTFGPIALRDTGNQIEKIEARYRSRFIDRTAAGKGNAVVEVWAKH